MTTTTATGYVGFLRIDGGRWERVCEGGSRDDVLAAVMAAADRAAGRNKDLIVLTSGERPDARPTKHFRVGGGTIDFRPARALSR
jgi:hypothetical protein